ncbi:MAG TPA: hypothetical protein VGE47_08125 [Burkholderiaceae bacterium]
MGGRRLSGWRPGLAGCLLCLLPPVARAEPAAAPPETITWFVQAMPPHFSYPAGRPPTTPAELGNGELDGLLRLLIGQMPSKIKHEFVEAGLARFELMAREGKAICSILHVRTDARRQWLYFTHLMPPPVTRDIHVVVRRERLGEFQLGGQTLRLQDLLQRHDIALLLPRGRAYGPAVDAVLRQQGQPGPHTVVLAQTTQLLSMLRAGRMDYTLEYPLVVDAFQRSSPPARQGEELVALPVVEGRSTQLATAACSRSPAGRRAIEVLDAAVRSLAEDPQREVLLRDWLGPQFEGERERILHYLDQRAKSGPQIE